jgi:hypothetical protein
MGGSAVMLTVSTIMECYVKETEDVYLVYLLLFVKRQAIGCLLDITKSS